VSFSDKRKLNEYSANIFLKHQPLGKTRLQMMCSVTKYTDFTDTFFNFKMSISQYPHTCNSTYAHKESTAFAMPTFTKLINAQQHLLHQI
jgi:hypothetical protein